MDDIYFYFRIWILCVGSVAINYSTFLLQYSKNIWYNSILFSNRIFCDFLYLFISMYRRYDEWNNRKFIASSKLKKWCLKTNIVIIREKSDILQNRNDCSI